MSETSVRAQALRTLLAAFPGTTAPDWVRRLGDEGLGGIVLFGHNIVDADQVTGLISALREGRPELIVSVDEEGGDVTRLGYTSGSRYPGNAALGAVDDEALTRQVYRALGSELAALGITLDLAPTVDVNSAPDNPIIGTRSFGTDPARVAAHTAAAVAGLGDAGVAACAKHFPGHGATRVDSHDTVPVVDAPLSVLRERDLPPFAAAISAGAPAIMTAHIRVPEVTGDLPATFSPAALHGLLRDELGFTGAIVTDALEMRGASGGHGLGVAAVRSLAAGADLLCLGARITEELVEATVAEIVAAVRDGRLPADRLADAAARSVTLATATRPDPARLRAAANGQEEIGLAAARRALRVHGVVPAAGRPLIVELDAPPTIAVGEVPWGLLPYLERTAADADLVRLRPMGDAPIDVPGLVARSAGGPIILVTRDTHRHERIRTLIEDITAAHPQVVLVEMGWPAWRPPRALGYLATYGAGPANARAAAEALLPS
ncbi:MAG TPA: glycoside hydrolase family 3 N-terminal domain-containing protein [Actinocatenispora sp.]